MGARLMEKFELDVERTLGLGERNGVADEVATCDKRRVIGCIADDPDILPGIQI